MKGERIGRQAAALAREIAPVIASRIAAEEAELIRAARNVAEAVTRLQQAKYSPAEISARRALETRALALRSALKARGEA